MKDLKENEKEPTRAQARFNLIAKAKKRCEKEIGGINERNWLGGAAPDSYDDEEYRVTVFALEGSDPKGYVLAAPGWVKAFSCWGDLYYTWKVEEEFQRMLKGANNG